MVYLDEETAALSLPIVKLNVSCSWKEFEVVTREVQLGRHDRGLFNFMRLTSSSDSPRHWPPSNAQADSTPLPALTYLTCTCTCAHVGFAQCGRP